MQPSLKLHFILFNISIGAISNDEQVFIGSNVSARAKINNNGLLSNCIGWACGGINCSKPHFSYNSIVLLSVANHILWEIMQSARYAKIENWLVSKWRCLI